MTDYGSKTQVVNVSEAGQQWGELVDRVSHSRERVIVEKGGVAVAAIISVSDLERLDRLEQERAHDFAVLDEIGEAFKDESPDEGERLARQAVAEARELQRQALRES